MGSIRPYWRRTGRYWILALLLHLVLVGLVALLRVPMPAPPEQPRFIEVEFVTRPAKAPPVEEEPDAASQQR